MCFFELQVVFGSFELKLCVVLRMLLFQGFGGQQSAQTRREAETVLCPTEKESTTFQR